MRWFKHMSNMRHDVKIRRLIQKYHADGYAVYNYILEAITEHLETESPAPILEETSEDIAIFFGVDVVRVEEIILFCINQGLIDQEEEAGRIIVKKIYKYLQQSETRSPQIRAMIANLDHISAPSQMSQTNVTAVTNVSDKCEEQNRTEQNRTHTDSRELSTGKYPEEIYKAWHSIGDKVIQPSSMIDFLTRIYGVEIHPIIRGIHSDDVLQAVRNFGKVVSGPPGRYWWTRKIGVGAFFQKHLDKFIPANFSESDFLVDQEQVETGPPKSINGYDARDKKCEECGGTIIGTLDCCPRCGWAPGQDRTDPGMQEFYKRNLSRHKVAV